MTGTENVNLTDTTGKYEMRVLTEFCCYSVCVCVCVSAGSLMPAQSTVAALMSSARSHGRHHRLRSALTFSCPTPSAARPSVNRQRRAPVSVWLKKTDIQYREFQSLFQCVRMRMRVGEEQCLWYPGLLTGSVFIYHGVQPPVRSFQNMQNVFV